MPKDLGKAAQLYQKAADEGYLPAQFRLGQLYHRAEGVPKDSGKAADLFQKVADHGYAPAQFNLGQFYQNGEGVPKVKQQSFTYRRPIKVTHQRVKN